MACSDVGVDEKGWRAAQEDLGRQIDPRTAKVFWGYSYIPYGPTPPGPDDEYSVGRLYFACTPDRRICVCFFHLPQQVERALRVRMADVGSDVFLRLEGDEEISW
jgi:hypothetical protein